jgi:RNA polymerase sigma-70 factor (ECF subfamily)
MSNSLSFAELIELVRRGDQDAATEVVRRYEPAIRLEVRRRLHNPNLYQLLDSLDICQSVLGSFFARAASGEYHLDHPEELLKLLLAMTRHKVADQSRAQRRQRRDRRRELALPSGAAEPASSEAEPWRDLAAREVLDEVYRRLSPRERELIQWRFEGHQWAAIVALCGGTPAALRKELSRALGRIARELGLRGDEG